MASVLNCRVLIKYLLCLQGVDNAALPGGAPTAAPAASGTTPNATPLPSSPAQVWFPHTDLCQHCIVLNPQKLLRVLGYS